MSIFICILLQLLCPEITKGEATYIFRHVSTINGLSNNEVTCMLRDSYGYLWIGTASGLNRWDGYRLKTYENNKTCALPSGDIISLQEDSDRNIWVEGRGEYSVYRRKTDSFEDAATYLSGFGISTEHLNKIDISPNGNIWFASGMQLYLLQHSTKQVTALSLPKKMEWDNIIADDKRLMVMSKSGHLYSLNITTKKWTAIAFPENSPYPNNMYIDQAGTLWLYSTLSHLLYYRDGSNWVAISIRPNDDVNNSVRGIQEDRHGNVWIASDHMGLYLYNKENKRQTNIQHNAASHSSIAENNIRCIHIDHEGILWVGYQKKGFSFFHPSHQRIDNFCSPTWRNVSCVLEDSKGDLWIGTDGFGVINTTQNKVLHFPGNTAVTLMEDNQGRLWIGTYMHGLVCNEGNNISVYTKTNSPLADNSVYSLCQDCNGTIWIGTLWGHLQSFHPDTGKWNDFPSEKDDESIAMCMYYDGKEELYAGMLSGLCRININDGQHTLLSGNRHGKTFRQKDIQILYRDSRGLLWLGHSQGLTVWNMQNDSLYYLDKEKGLCDNVTRGICEDRYGRLWVSTSNGCSAITVGQDENHQLTFHFDNYTTTDGLLDNNLSRHSICLLHNGHLLLGSSEGYSVIDLSIPKPKSSPTPAITFTGLRLGGQAISPQRKFNGHVLLKHPIEERPELFLKSSDTQIEIEFSSMDLPTTGKTRYAYRLVGETSEWTETTEGHALFNTLQPGEYKFQVKVYNNEKGWSKPSTLIIHVEGASPILWLSLTVCLLLAGIMWQIKRKMQKERDKSQTGQSKMEIEPSAITITPLDEQLIQKAIKCVEEHLTDDFTVEDLSQAMGMTRGHLYKKFMAITGKGPADFIRTIRLKRACQLLSGSDLQIAEIAYAVGYSSPKIFSRNFKAEYGMTPGEYRKLKSPENNTSTPLM